MQSRRGGPAPRAVTPERLDLPLREALPELGSGLRTLAQLGIRAHDLAERGLVHLVQLRHGAEDYSYFAIARPRREGTLPDFASLTITEEAA